MKFPCPSILATAVAVSPSACATATGDGMMATSTPYPYQQDDLPAAVKVAAGHTAAIATTGIGEITYECRAKVDMQGAHQWVFVGPRADLVSRQGNARLGTYYGPPATWASIDGSKLTGVPVATAPSGSGSGNIPLQLVKANPASGAGAMSGVSYIQRVATKGGVAPASTCEASSVGRKEIVRYQADYLFWKAG